MTNTNHPLSFPFLETNDLGQILKLISLDIQIAPLTDIFFSSLPTLVEFRRHLTYQPLWSSDVPFQPLWRLDEASLRDMVKADARPDIPNKRVSIIT